MSKTFSSLRNDLNEFRILRVASAVGFASRIKSSRQKVEAGERNLKTILKRITDNDDAEKKLDYQTDALMVLSEQMSNVANQISSLSAISVTGLVTNERSNKQIIKLIK